MSEFDDLPVELDGGDLAPYRPENPLPPSPWSDTPAPAPQADYLTERGQPQQPQNTAADIRRQIAQLPPSQRQQAEEAVAMITNFGRSMVKSGVAQSVIVAAGAWMDKSLTAGKVPAERRTHVFDLRAFDLQDDPYAVSFANAMERAGASQSDLRKILNWYKRWEAQQHRNTTRQPRQNHQPAQDFAAQDARDRAHAEIVLKAEWGQSYATNIRTINRYLNGLPAAEREQIETATLPSGGLELNNPDILEYLLKKATSGPSPLAAEIQALETRMRTDRKAWFRDDAAQARLRALYQQRGG